MSISYTVEVIWCRTFQTVLKFGNYFMGYRMPFYLEGPGKVKELGKFLKEKKIDTKDLITHTFDMEQIHEAVELFENRRDGVMKVVIHM